MLAINNNIILALIDTNKVITKEKMGIQKYKQDIMCNSASELIGADIVIFRLYYREIDKFTPSVKGMLENFLRQKAIHLRFDKKTSDLLIVFKNNK